jgi:choline kinase
MKALILAAGVGKRLAGSSDDLPKVLLRFGSTSLLERHLSMLASCGVTDVTIVIGHRGDAIKAELERIGRNDVRTYENPRYREGSVVSLWSARDVLRHGDSVLLMDADVLYDSRLLKLLLTTPIENCFLMAEDLAVRTEIYVADGRTGMEHEEPVRDMILEHPPGTFGFVDATGLPWIEIDFAEDVARAKAEILPRLVD